MEGDKALDGEVGSLLDLRVASSISVGEARTDLDLALTISFSFPARFSFLMNIYSSSSVLPFSKRRIEVWAFFPSPYCNLFHFAVSAVVAVVIGLVGLFVVVGFVSNNVCSVVVVDLFVVSVISAVVVCGGLMAAFSSSTADLSLVE